jgi:SanA protein
MLKRFFILVLLVCIPILILPRLLASWYSRKLIYNLEDAPPKRVAIVFGAGLWRDGSPTPVLRDRVATAARLYFSGKVEKLLMSGDNRFWYYNEPASMQAYALELGIPAEDIVLDYAGRRTYDTCYRARHIFKLDEVILVTQSFHMPRALYVCNSLGISAIGVPADFLAQQAYRRSSKIFWNLREIPATLVALWEVYISRPLPVLGNPEPIFPLEAQ